MTALLEAQGVMALGPRGAVAAIRSALLAGLDPDAAPARSIIDLAHGQALLMPAQDADWFGVKVVTIAPDNPTLGHPRINGLYLLHDAATLRPVAILDGVALTTLRTPAVSVTGVLDVLTHRFGARRGIRLVVFGSGPQSTGHHETLEAHLAITSTTVVARSVESAARAGIQGAELLAAGDPGVTVALETADVVVAATTARTPLFDGSLVRDDAVVVAVGSHEPEARELDSILMGRATVVVESVPTALREAGDVVLAAADGALDPESLLTMDAVVGRDAAAYDGRPLVLVTTGMAWEDLAVAVAAYRHQDLVDAEHRG